MSWRNDLILGVDGGNTKTVAVVAEPAGRIVGVGRGGCSDIYGAASVDAALTELGRSVEGALADAGVRASDLTAAVFSLAGADWPEDITFLKEWIIHETGIANAVVVNDSIGGLRSGTDDGVGIAVICGTYCAIGARHVDGSTFHLGFWPDTTGSVDLATKAFKAVCREALELGPHTSLTQLVLEHFEAIDVLELLHSFTRREGGRDRERMVELTPVLLGAADDGDVVSQQIVAEAGRVLGRTAGAAARRIGLQVRGASVVLSGGVFRHPSVRLESSVMEHLPGAVAVRASVQPVLGALMLANDAAGRESDISAFAASWAELHLHDPQSRSAVEA